MKWLSNKQILLIAKSIRVGTEANFNHTSTLEFEIHYCQHEKCKTQEMPGSEDGNQLFGSQIARNLPTAASYEIVPWFSRPNRPLCTCARIVCAGHQLLLYKRQHTRANKARAQNVKYADSHQVHCRRGSRRRKTTCWEIFPTLHVTLFLQSVQHAPCLVWRKTLRNKWKILQLCQFSR